MHVLGMKIIILPLNLV